MNKRNNRRKWRSRAAKRKARNRDIVRRVTRYLREYHNAPPGMVQDAWHALARLLVAAHPELFPNFQLKHTANLVMTWPMCGGVITNAD